MPAACAKSCAWSQLYHLRGYAAWRLGVEDPEFWQELTSDN